MAETCKSCNSYDTRTEETSYKCDCVLDYESEYYRLREEVRQLCEENAILRDTLIGMCKHIFRRDNTYGQGRNS